MSNREIAFHILITDDEDYVPLPDEKITSFVQRTQWFDYEFYNLKRLRAFIKDNYQPQVLKVFDGLVPYSYKADLAKYCLLYHYGGWYSDINNLFVSELPQSEDKNLICFRDTKLNNHTAWDLACGLIYSKKHSPIMMMAIDRILFNYNNNFYGRNPLYPTGPVLFGYCAAHFGMDNDMTCYDLLKWDETEKRVRYVDDNGTVICYGKNYLDSGAGNALHKGTNNYVTMWNNRQIYKKVGYNVNS